MVMGKLSIALISAALLLLFASVAAQENILVSTRIPDCPWADSHLDERLNLYLTSITNVPIIRRQLPAFADTAGFTEILAWGRQQNARFLVDISMARIDLERRKQTIFPLLLFRYRTYAVATGTIRIIDFKKGRMTKLENIAYELKASDQWQIFDDEKDDPELMVPADRKQILFDRLDDNVALSLCEQIKALTRGNHFGS